MNGDSGGPCYGDGGSNVAEVGSIAGGARPSEMGRVAPPYMVFSCQGNADDSPKLSAMMGSELRKHRWCHPVRFRTAWQASSGIHVGAWYD